ncbi:hypothetical protein BHM03_00048430, partial [Ensete ventricosum]
KATRRGSKAWPSHLQWGGRLQPSSPSKGAVARRGGHPLGQQPPTGTTGSGQVARGDCPRRACKGRSAATRPQGAVARGAPIRGQPLATRVATVRKGQPPPTSINFRNSKDYPCI